MELTAAIPVSVDSTREMGYNVVLVKTPGKQDSEENKTGFPSTTKKPLADQVWVDFFSTKEM